MRAWCWTLSMSDHTHTRAVLVLRVSGLPVLTTCCPDVTDTTSTLRPGPREPRARARAGAGASVPLQRPGQRGFWGWRCCPMSHMLLHLNRGQSQPRQLLGRPLVVMSRTRWSLERWGREAWDLNYFSWHLHNTFSCCPGMRVLAGTAVYVHGLVTREPWKVDGI